MAGAKPEYLYQAMQYAIPAMGKASLIQAGNDYGATRGKYLRNIQRISRGESIWTSSAACILLICLWNVILKLYHLEGTELVLGLDIMIPVALVSFPEAQAMTHAGILRGIGRTGYVAKYYKISGVSYQQVKFSFAVGQMMTGRIQKKRQKDCNVIFKIIKYVLT